MLDGKELMITMEYIYFIIDLSRRGEVMSFKN
jgi:hypothetical protein